MKWYFIFSCSSSILKIKKCHISNRLLSEMIQREKDSIYLKKCCKLSSSTKVLNLIKIVDLAIVTTVSNDFVKWVLKIMNNHWADERNLLEVEASKAE